MRFSRFAKIAFKNGQTEPKPAAQPVKKFKNLNF